MQGLRGLAERSLNVVPAHRKHEAANIDLTLLAAMPQIADGRHLAVPRRQLRLGCGLISFETREGIG